MWNNSNTLVLVEMQNGADFLESTFAVFLEIKIHILYDLSALRYSTHRCFLREMKHDHKYLHENVHNSFTHDSPKLKTNKISIYL